MQWEDSNMLSNINHVSLLIWVCSSDAVTNVYVVCLEASSLRSASIEFKQEFYLFHLSYRELLLENVHMKSNSVGSVNSIKLFFLFKFKFNLWITVDYYRKMDVMILPIWFVGNENKLETVICKS